jgi:hypothetical protein
VAGHVKLWVLVWREGSYAYIGVRLASVANIRTGPADSLKEVIRLVLRSLAGLEGKQGWIGCRAPTTEVERSDKRERHDKLGIGDLSVC